MTKKTTVGSTRDRVHADEIRRAILDELSGVDRRSISRISGVFEDIVRDYFGPEPSVVARGIRDGLLAQFERNFCPIREAAQISGDRFYGDDGVEVAMFAMVCRACGVHDDWSPYRQRAEEAARIHNLSLHPGFAHG